MSVGRTMKSVNECTVENTNKLVLDRPIKSKTSEEKLDRWAELEKAGKKEGAKKQDENDDDKDKDEDEDDDDDDKNGSQKYLEHW